MSCVFEAVTAGGALRIALAQPAGDAVGSALAPPAGDAVGSALAPPAGDAVAAALALADHEALIVALEDWLQQPLDLRPLTRTDAVADADPALLWARCGALRLGFAWSLLLNAASVPSARTLPVEWPELGFEIDVAEFNADPRPVAAQPADAHADPGDAVLLLPPAFEPAWRVALHGVGTTGAAGAIGAAGTITPTTPPPLWAEAEWRGPGTALVLCGAPQSGPRRRGAWRVQLDTRYQRTLPELLGWVTSADRGVPAAPPRVSGAAHLIAPGRPALAGSIAPALGGAGLWITG